MVHISMIKSSTMKRLLSQLGYWKDICIIIASHLSTQLNLKVVCKQCGLFQSYSFLHCLPQSMCISSSLVLGLDNCRQMELLSHSVLSHCLLFGHQTAASLKYIAQVPLLLFFFHPLDRACRCYQMKHSSKKMSQLAFVRLSYSS